MSFQMYRPAFMPGPVSLENKMAPLLGQPLGLPARPLLASNQMMPDNAVPRFMPAPPGPQMLTLPPTGMVPHQQQAAQNMLAFNHPAVDNKTTAGPTSNLGSSMPNNVQGFMNPPGVSFQGMNFGVLPPGLGGTTVPMGMGIQPPLLPSSGQPSLQVAPPQGGIESFAQEVDPDQPMVDPQRTCLDFFNSDLHLEISKSGYEAKNITDPPGFCFCWAGVRATHGVSGGKVFYEVRITENLKVDFGDDHRESDPHLLRIGWSAGHSSLQLGEEMDSWGYGGTGKFSTNNKFAPYGEPYALGDVVAAHLDLESKPPTMSFSKNGCWMGVACPLYGYKVGCQERALFPHILSKNCRFEVNFGQQNVWCPQHLSMGHRFVDHHHPRVRGLQPPNRKADCEMIMIVGLPGAGKTTWGLKMFRDHPDKCYNIIGTDTLIDKMKVMGLPRRNNYHGRWEVLIQKATACLNKLFLIAGRRRRNYILDQTNVYLSARKRKMRHFAGFKRICAIIQPEDEELKRREWKRTFEDGKVVPEDAVLEMKYNYSLPDAGDDYVDEVVWIELDQQDSKEVVKSYGEEARMKLPSRNRAMGPDSEQNNEGAKRMKMWEQQPIGMDGPMRQVGDMMNPPPEFKFNYSDVHQQSQQPQQQQQQQHQQQQQQHHHQGFPGMQHAPPHQNQQEPPGQPFQSMPPVGVPPPSMPSSQTLAMPQAPQTSSSSSYETWDGRLRMPGSQGTSRPPHASELNPSGSFSVPDLSRPPPAFPPQFDGGENSQRERFENWSPSGQGGYSGPSGSADIRGGVGTGATGDSDRRFGSEDVARARDSGVVNLFDLPDPSERFDYRGSRGDHHDRDSREGRFGDRREDWRQERNPRRGDVGEDYRRSRDREDSSWRDRRDGRPFQRTPDGARHGPRGRAGSEGGRGRDERRWNNGSGSRDGGQFQDRPRRNKWEEGGNGSPAPFRQQRSLLGDSPLPLIPAEMMDEWKDPARPQRLRGDFGSPRRQHGPPPDARFSGPRANRPPPPLRGPRPMPPRVPPPSVTFRGPSQNWP